MILRYQTVQNSWKNVTLLYCSVISLQFERQSQKHTTAVHRYCVVSITAILQDCQPLPICCMICRGIGTANCRPNNLRRAITAWPMIADEMITCARTTRPSKMVLASAPLGYRSASVSVTTFLNLSITSQCEIVVSVKRALKGDEIEQCVEIID